MKTLSMKHQQGVSLFIVLMLLLIMTVLGLAGLRGTVMQERMSGNLLDRSIAFQAAESALREAEAIARTAPDFPGAPGVAADSVCLNGLCQMPTGAVDRWNSIPVGQWRNATAPLGPLNAGQAQFIIEEIGTGETSPGCSANTSVDPLESGCLTPRYRITARGIDPTVAANANRSQVILTANYAP
jgi:type IV pilus assembly protein PilX